MGGKMIGNYANDGTLYISATNIQEFKCLINKAKKQADELQDTINQLEFFNFHFKFATDEQLFVLQSYFQLLLQKYLNL